jgi:hypothetical protein
MGQGDQTRGIRYELLLNQSLLEKVLEERRAVRGSGLLVAKNPCSELRCKEHLRTRHG